MTEHAITMNGEEISSLTDAQEKILSLLPIVPTLASTVASGTILSLVYKSGFKTSYKRILFGLSVADIITSITCSLQPFLLPSDTSQNVWASGNDATCTFLGTLTQLALASLLYNGILSYYFLLTIRFGVKETAFATRYEPWMHAVAIGYPLLTAVVGAAMGFFHEFELGQGCWVSHYPEGCVDNTGQCKSPLIAWIFSGIWVVVIFFSVLFNNIIIYRHVKQQLTRGRRHSMDSERQTKRIRDVAMQAFLYVAAFVGTFIWTVVLRIMEGQSYGAADEAALFPLLVLQAMLVPSTGVFNLCIYLRPRYLKTRSDYPTESRLWAARRALYGEAIQRSAINDSRRSSSITQYASMLFRKKRSNSHLNSLESLPEEAHPDRYKEHAHEQMDEAESSSSDHKKLTSVLTTSEFENVANETIDRENIDDVKRSHVMCGSNDVSSS